MTQPQHQTTWKFEIADAIRAELRHLHTDNAFEFKKIFDIVEATITREREEAEEQGQVQGVVGLGEMLIPKFKELGIDTTEMEKVIDEAIAKHPSSLKS